VNSGRSEAARSHVPGLVGLCSVILFPRGLALLSFWGRLIEAVSKWTGFSSHDTFGVLSFSVCSLQVLLLVCFVRYCEHKGPKSIGIQAVSSLDVLWAVVLGCSSLWITGLTARIEAPFHPRPGMALPPRLTDTGLAYVGNLLNGSYLIAQGTSQGAAYAFLIMTLPLSLALVLLASGAVWEELAYRAYVFERMAGLTKSIWLGALSSLVVSLALHVPAWGITGAVRRLPLFLILVLFYIWRRNALACALAHFLSNAMLVVLLRLPASIRPELYSLFGFPRFQ
jgi:membrane protease YdiL (CAAX protease family)